MSLSGRVDARPATKLCILRIMTPAEGGADLRRRARELH